MTLEKTIYYLCAVHPEVMPNRSAALNHLLFVNGNGYDWKEGQLQHMHGEEGIELNQLILKAFSDQRESDRRMPHRINRRIEYAVPADIEQRVQDTSFVNWYPLCEYAKICQIPEKVEADWLEGATEVITLYYANHRKVSMRQYRNDMRYLEMAEKRIRRLQPLQARAG